MRWCHNFLTLSEINFSVLTLSNVGRRVKIMRDGLFNSAPVSRAWKRAGDCSAREADQGENTSNAIADALAKDIRKAMKELKGVFAFVHDGRISLLKAGELAQFFASYDFSVSGFARRIVDQCAYICRGGTPFDSGALIEAVARSSQTQVAAMQADLFGNMRKNVSEDVASMARKEFSRAAASFNYTASAKAAVDEGYQGKPKKKSEFDYDAPVN